MLILSPRIDSIRVSVESLSSNTTAKDHFKDWNARPPTRSYNEHPSYAGEGEKELLSIFRQQI
jgi:hypothetical protein